MPRQSCELKVTLGFLQTGHVEKKAKPFPKWHGKLTHSCFVHHEALKRVGKFLGHGVCILLTSF